VHEVENVANYNIKKKHLANMNCFFDSKNFEFKTKLVIEEPVIEKGKKGADSKLGAGSKLSAAKGGKSFSPKADVTPPPEEDPNNLLVVKGIVQDSPEEVEE
jgi:hypothetical protein